MNKNKIFISHSTKDVNIVKSFVENILKLGLDISSDRIFCSSMEGQGIKSGQYIPDRLREEINISIIAFLFISKNYKSSEVCLNEVGAAWATLPKENVIPLILPNVDFHELGFLDIGRLGLKIKMREDISKLIQDTKDILNPNYNLARLNHKIDVFINELGEIEDTTLSGYENALFNDSGPNSFNEWTDCFTNNLFALDDIIRKAIPAHNDGIHEITSVKMQNQILTELSKADFLKRFGYKRAEGDFYVERLKKLPSGNWLMTVFNWDIKVSKMWVCMSSEFQYEFILIQSMKQEPYKIDSDIGGESYRVGILSDGTIVSENERQNGYAIIEGETIDLNTLGVEARIRYDRSNWVFLVSKYHKAGYNNDETVAFCEKLDSGEIEVNEENLFNFLRPLDNHPVVIENY